MDATSEFPAGQLKHLSTTQEEAFQAMRRRCLELGIYQPATEDHAASHDDGTLLRFLRARKFDVEGAVSQFADTVEWREENAIEEVYEKIDLEEYEEARQLYTEWTGRRDKRGFPLYVFEIGSLDTGRVSSYEHATALRGIDRDFSTSVKMVRLFALFEHMTQFVGPLCTAAKDRPYAGDFPITQGCYIVDVENLGLRQAWSLKKHLQDSSDLASRHYPETLGTIFIVGAPSFFPSVWSWIKRWLDPVIASKTFILSSKEVLPTLSKYVEREHIPRKYGGGLDWNFGDLPNVDPALMALLKPSADNQSSPISLPIGPIRWEKDSAGEMMAVALGAEDEGPRHQPFATYHGAGSDMYYSTPLEL